MSKIICVIFICVSAAYSQTFQEFIKRINSSPEIQKKRLVEDFLSKHSQLPVIEQDTLCHFIYKGNAKSVSIAGDLTGWNPDIAILSNIKGSDFWYKTFTFSADTRLDYKLVLNRRDWILDPGNPNQSLSGYGTNSELRMPKYKPPKEIEYYPEIAHGSMWDTTFYSEELKNERPVKVYLPANYASTTDSFALVLFHDGLDYLNLANAKNVLDYFIAQNHIEPVIGLFVPAVNRNDEYIKKQKESFSKFLVRKVIAEIDRKFRTKINPKKRAVVGISAGGNIALWMGLHYSNVFENIAAHSSYIESGLFAGFQNASKTELKLFIDLGKYDIPMLIPLVQSFVPLIRAKGFEYKYFELNDSHNWANWRRHLDDALQFFFPGKAMANITAEKSDKELVRFEPHIKFSVSDTSQVEINIYNLKGKLIQTLFNTKIPGSEYAVAWDGFDFRNKKQPCGLYFCSIKIENKLSEMRRIVNF